ncbi:MAG: Abi family protein [Puniceicoccales bacterium]|nr:Abi family protein [Puniceicoccales bacterium]
MRHVAPSSLALMGVLDFLEVMSTTRPPTAAALPYDKPFLSIAEQRALLASRGMGVRDSEEADHYLRHEGYYRLSTYFNSFCKHSADGKRLDAFLPESDFHEVVRLYDFDKHLRSILLPALRGVEISVRVAVAHHLGRQDIFAHENPQLLAHSFTHGESTWRGKSWYQVWLDKYNAMLSRDDQEDFVRQFISKYGRRIPIWVAIEVWDFGLLSRFFGGMRFPDQHAVSKLYGVDDPKIFASWLRNFNYVRNVCAHHSRLWNRNITEQPRLVQKQKIHLLRHLTMRGVKAPGARVYATVALVTYVLRMMRQKTPWREAVVKLLESFPQCGGVSLGMMGVPEDWRELELWRSD